MHVSTCLVRNTNTLAIENNISDIRVEAGFAKISSKIAPIQIYMENVGDIA